MLDTFLNGLLSDCSGSKSFGRFRKSVAARYAYDADGKRQKPNAPIAAPPDVKSAMGPITAKNEGEYTDIIVPISGTFRSLRVSALQFGIGNENGIDVTTVRFAASRSEVAKTLGRDIARVDRLLKRRVQSAETGADQSISLVDERGQAHLVCDTSN